MLKRYSAFFDAPGVVRFVVVSFLARLPIGTLGLSTLLYVRDLTGSIAFAGTVVGAQLIASAIMAPVLGRIIDTRGPRPVLLATAIVPGVSIPVVLFAGALALPYTAILLACVVTGAFIPPITTIARTIWRHRFADERMRQTAFAFDAVLIELSFTLGPSLVALLVATASSRSALALAWLFTVAAVPLLYASGGMSWWKDAPATKRHLLGPLRERQLLVVYAATFGLTLSFGALEVGYPGFGLERGSAAWGPALIAVNSIGSAIGGLAYGAWHVAMPIERQLPRLMAWLALPVLLHLLVDSVWPMVPLAFAAGVLIAPSMTAATLLVSRYAPPSYVTEAFTWSATAIVTGIGAGMALGGAMVERYGAKSAFVLATASALCAASVALALRTPSPRPEFPERSRSP
jgi:MFS family permease